MTRVATCSLILNEPGFINRQNALSGVFQIPDRKGPGKRASRILPRMKANVWTELLEATYRTSDRRGTDLKKQLANIYGLRAESLSKVSLYSSRKTNRLTKIWLRTAPKQLSPTETNQSLRIVNVYLGNTLTALYVTYRNVQTGVVGSSSKDSKRSDQSDAVSSKQCGVRLAFSETTKRVCTNRPFFPILS